MTQQRLVLVTGCARSGTLYISRVMKAVGLEVGHEYVGEHGTASHFFAPRVKLPYQKIVSKAPKGRCIHVGEQRTQFKFVEVFHQVRHPLKVISSLRWTGVREDHLRLGTGVNTEKLSRVHRGLIYWVEWNKLIESQSTLRYRIEDIDAVFPEVCKRLGIAVQPVPDTKRDTHTSLKWMNPYAVLATDAAGKNVGRIPYKDRKAIVKSTPLLTWDVLRQVDPAYTKRAQEMAERYGY